MCKILEDMCNEAVQARNVELARKMLKRGDSMESIADLLEISVDEVRKIAETAKA